jgi:ribulose-phosphate 3-epimerase
MVEKAGADYIHVDVMDGNFVPNISIGQPVVTAVRKITELPLDVHLMINDPDKYIEEFAKAGADIICIHQEACLHLDRSISLIKELGKKAAVSLNPATDINTLKYVLDKLDMVLLMSVNPGFGGQEFIESSIGKIAELRKMADELNPGMDIEVDGGITLDNVERVVKAGANVIVAGSGIYKADDPASVISRMRELAEK